MTRILQNKLIILFAIVIAWFPVFFVSFINDDFQILGYHAGGTFLSIFAPFWKQDISVYYWRPIGNMLHPLMLLLFGFNFVPFRLLSIILYTLVCWTLASFIEETGVKKEYAVLTAVFFALLPSHEYQIAWIADQGECLVTIFLLLTFRFYKKNKVISLLLFCAALLTKESAFAGIFIPFIYYLLDKKKYPFKTSLCDFGAAVVIIICLQLYRYFVPGGTPFNSSNFEATNPLKWIINFFTYTPISFVQPEFLEILSNSSLAIIVSTVGLFFILYFVYSVYKKLAEDKKKIFFAGLAWFIFFILPALPKFMRWYVFTASAGIMLSIAVLLETISIRKYFLLIAYLVIMCLAVIDFSTMAKWKFAGDKMKEITASLRIVSGKDDVFLFALPEKINRVPVMKLGLAETVKFSSGLKNLNVYAILRTECFTDDPSVEIKTENDSTISFYITDGRFKNREGRSYSYLKQENNFYTEEGIKIEIKNAVNGTNRSSAKVIIPKKIKAQNLYYNGHAFIAF